MGDKVSNVQCSFGDASFKVFFVDENKIEKGHALWHVHHFYELHVCVSGSCTHKTESRDYRQLPGQLFLIPPGVLHGSDAAQSLGAECVVMRFTLSRGADAYHCYDYVEQTLLGSAMRPVSLPEEVVKQFQQFQKLHGPNSFKEYCQVKAKASVLLFDLIDLLSDAPAGSDHPLSMHDHDDTLVLLNILVNQCELPLKAIAARLNYSERQTSRLIRQMYNKSLSEIYESNSLGRNAAELCDEP